MTMTVYDEHFNNTFADRFVVRQGSMSLQWRYNGHDGVSNQLPQDCLLIRLFRCRSKKTSKLRVIGLCEENSPVIGEFPAQMDSNAENVSTWWRHHDNQAEWKSQCQKRREDFSII